MSACFPEKYEKYLDLNMYQNPSELRKNRFRTSIW